MHLLTKYGQKIEFSLLQTEDGLELGLFFTQLTSKTKNRFGPHPLTLDYAQELCHKLNDDSADRYVLKDSQTIIGYFILEHLMSEHEQKRYAQLGITLHSNKDLLFAPCIKEQYQNQGLASQGMKQLIEIYTGKINSLVLMGGTQETNTLGIAFYKKWGFMAHGGYQSDIYNIDMRLILKN